MNRSATLLVLILVIAAVAVMHAQSVIVVNQDAFFNDQVLHEIRLYVHPTDWATLKARFQENIYFPADMTWRFGNAEIPVEQVGIRSRGLGSRNGIKPGLLINFARYNDDARFLGLRAVVLRNNVQDPSQMHEHLGMTFFRRMGLPASRTAMTRLFVNDENMGVYTIVENIDAEFLQRHFNQQNGYLYSYDYGIGTLPYFFEYKGPDPALYSPHPFEPENHQDNPDPRPIVDMIRTINQASDAEFFSAMSRYLDLRLFMRHLAVETFLAEEDGIIGDFGLNNFYIYRFEGGDRFQFMPWDKSQVFSSLNRGFFRNVDSNVLTRRAMSIPELRTVYVNAVLESGTAAGGPGGWLEQDIARLYGLIGGAVRSDPKKLCYGPGFAYISCPNEQFEAAVAFMTQFARERNTILRREIFPTSQGQQ